MNCPGCNAELRPGITIYIFSDSLVSVCCSACWVAGTIGQRLQWTRDTALAAKLDMDRWPIWAGIIWSGWVPHKIEKT